LVVGLPHSIEEVCESGWREGGSGNAEGFKGDICWACRTGGQMVTKLESLTLRARGDPKCRFTSLAHLLSEDFLKECFWELKRDKASGIDGVTVQEYEVNLEENLRDLVERMKAKRYRPQPLRRVYIPKPDGSKRGLGIPAVEDKIVQMGIKKILERGGEKDEEDFGMDIGLHFCSFYGCLTHGSG
jgi:hypothetical protein